MKLIVEDWNPAKAIITTASGMRIRLLMKDAVMTQITNVLNNVGTLDLEFYGQPEGKILKLRHNAHDGYWQATLEDADNAD